jgi:UDP-2,4-diacetamido-2,4,6-trideoxy-beta-L-altropyranose hydrolase
MQDLLLIRTDASISIGTGHIMRMIALAQAWRKSGGNALFLCAVITPALEETINSNGFLLEKIVATPGSRTDLEATVSAINRSKNHGSACAVALDGYHFMADFQLGLKNAGCRLLVMDDYGHADFYHADFVLNQNISACAELYAKHADDTELLLGPNYALLRTEFSVLRSWRREIGETATKLLVTMGGADPENVTGTIVHALADSGLVVKVVVGGSNPHLPSLSHAARSASRGATHVELVVNASNMAGLMKWADLAVASGGSTSWELAFTGLPTLFVVLAGNQEQSTVELERQGFGVCLGKHSKLSKPCLRNELEKLAGDCARRADFASRGRKIVDGLGTDRVVSILKNTGRIQLDKVTERDARILWEWANDPATRENSFDSAPIPWQIHECWHQAKLRDPACTFLMASTQELGKIGVVRFDQRDSEATISVSLAPSARGKGYGSKVIQSACQRFLIEAPSVEAVHAWIKPTNQASIRAFERVHFQHHADTRSKDQPAKHYVLRRSSS